MNARKSELENKRAQALRANLKRRKQAKCAQADTARAQKETGQDKKQDTESRQK